MRPQQGWAKEGEKLQDVSIFIPDGEDGPPTDGESGDGEASGKAPADEAPASADEDSAATGENAE